MTWIAIPLAGLTVVSTLAGGALGLRLHRELQTAIALSGGIVVAVALFDLIPEAFEAVGDEDRVMSLVGAGFVLFSSPTGTSSCTTETIRRRRKRIRGSAR